MALINFGDFRIRLTLLLGGLSLLLGLVSTWYVDQFASAQMSDARSQTLKGIAQAVANALETNLSEREREIVLLSKAPSVRRDVLSSSDIRTFLDEAKSSYRHYVWLGIADSEGVVRVAAGKMLEGESVAKRPWFMAGRKGPFVGDVHEAVMLARKLPASSTKEPLRLVDFAAPIYDDSGRFRGVLATHASWRWVAEVVAKSLPTTALSDRIEVFIVSDKGEVLYPFEAIGLVKIPAIARGVNPVLVTAWGSDDYLVSNIPVTPVNSRDLGWRVIVRQPVTNALAPVAELHHHLLLLGVLMAALVMSLSYHLAGRFSQPLRYLAWAAWRVANGEEDSEFNTSGGINEVRDLSQSLREMTRTLISQKRELEGSNSQLEQKVESRTKELQQQKALNESIVHASSNGLLLYRADGQCILANNAAARIVGTSASILAQQNFHEIAIWKEEGLELHAIQALQGRESQCLVSAQSSFGKTVDCLFTFVPLQHNEQAMVLVFLKDVSELVEANRALERLARRDALTGVYNRLAANEKLRTEFLRMKRTSSRYSVLLMDIDHFKNVNDSYGHEAGDAVLKQVASLLHTLARESDFVARFGGEEFLVVLPDTLQEGALVVADKIRANIAETIFTTVGQVTLSIGVATTIPTDANEDEAVCRADRALYSAKALGRNRVAVSQS